MAGFDEAVERFLNHIRVSRTGSNDTEDAYRRDIERFVGYLEDEKIKSFEKVDKAVISDYVLKLRSGDFGNKPLSNASYARNLSSLRSFYRYLNRYEGIENTYVPASNSLTGICIGSEKLVKFNASVKFIFMPPSPFR